MQNWKSRGGALQGESTPHQKTPLGLAGGCNKNSLLGFLWGRSARNAHGVQITKSSRLAAALRRARVVVGEAAVADAIVVAEAAAAADVIVVGRAVAAFASALAEVAAAVAIVAEEVAAAATNPNPNPNPNSRIRLEEYILRCLCLSRKQLLKESVVLESKM
jgi:hypothetical protein